MGAAATQGIEWPSGSIAAGERAWLKYWSERGTNTTLELGIANDADDNIRINAPGGVDIIGSGDLRIARNLTVAGTSVFTAATTFNNLTNFRRELVPVVGAGATHGVEWPSGSIAAGERAWLKYWSERGTNTVLELGIANDADDNIRINAPGGVDIIGSGDLRIARNLTVAGTTVTTGVVTHNNYTVFNKEIRPKVGAAAAQGIEWPSGSIAAGERAWLKYSSERGSNTVLELGVANDADDNIRINAAGGTDITGSGDLRVARSLTVGGQNVMTRIAAIEARLNAAGL